LLHALLRGTYQPLARAGTLPAEADNCDAFFRLGSALERDCQIKPPFPISAS
jgi:hypothetical protein